MNNHKRPTPKLSNEGRKLLELILPSLLADREKACRAQAARVRPYETLAPPPEGSPDGPLPKNFNLKL